MFLLPTKQKQKEAKLHSFIVYTPDSPSQNSRLKKKTSLDFLSVLSLIASIKNIKQNIQESIVQCWFYKTSIKILRLINKAQTHFC